VTSDGVANTNVVWHGGRLLALEEGHAPIAIDPVTIDTLGPYDFARRLTSNMTAHPKIDPVTGEMLFFANFPARRFDGRILLYRANAAGEIVDSATVRGPYPALVHDFAVTARFVIVVICPLTLSLDRLRSGAAPIAWEPGLGTHVGVCPRNALADVRWYRGPPGMVWHTMNAFEEGGCIHVDLCRQDAPAFPSPDGGTPTTRALEQRPMRWTLDPAHDAVRERPLADLVAEYPRIDERRSGLPYRYGFVACDGGPGTNDLFHRGIARIDLVSGGVERFHAGTTCAVSEPVFVPASTDAREGEGWLLVTVFDEKTNTSRLAVLDAGSVGAGPVAQALLDHRVPAGFHGTWRPG